MRIFFLFLPLFFLCNALYANESKVCQKCHPIIYEEYYTSSHRNSSTTNNPIHKAMWEAYPKDEKGYTCAKCHSPSDSEALQKGILLENEIQSEEPISCVFCHTIKNVQEGEHANINITTGEKQEFYTAENGKKGNATYETKSSWFGLLKEPKSSPYHKIDYDNEGYYSGNICMGCHSHTNNEHGFDIIMLDALINKEDKNSCVTCHMPQVLGTKVTINGTQTHAYHGIAGIHQMSEKMGAYIEFQISKKSNAFVVTLINKANHALFGHSLRQGILKATINRGGKNIELEPFVFERVLAKDGKEAMPWNANSVLKDTLIYAKKDVTFAQELQKGDKLTLTLTAQRISEQGAKKLGVEAKKELTKSRVLKSEKFEF